MTDEPIVANCRCCPIACCPPKRTRKWPDLHTFWQRREQLPAFVRNSPTIMRNLELLGPLDWASFPSAIWALRGQTKFLFAALVARHPWVTCAVT